jgi:hypothetical protein
MGPTSIHSFGKEQWLISWEPLKRKFLPTKYKDNTNDNFPIPAKDWLTVWEGHHLRAGLLRWSMVEYF